MYRRIVAILVLCILVGIHTSSSAEDNILYAAHTEGELNVRESPYGDRVGYLCPGDLVEFIEQKGDWVHVKVGVEAGEGWVKVDYLTVDLEAAGSYTNASGGRLRIRETPNGKASGWLKAGATVTVTAVLPDEDGVLWGKTKRGYIQMKWLEAAQ